MWVEKRCHNIELLRILTHCYTILDQLLNDATEQLGSKKIYPKSFVAQQLNFHELLLISDHKLPKNFKDFQENRIIWYKLPEFEPVELIDIQINRDESIKDLLKSRYGFMPKRLDPSGSLKEKVDYQADIAKRILKVDKKYLSTLLLFDKNCNLDIRHMDFIDITDKYLLWDKTYKYIKENFIKELIFSYEIWVANPNKITNNIDSLNKLPDTEKSEALMIIGCNYKNEFISKIVTFTRSNDEIIFSEEIISHECNVIFILPVLEIWNGWRKIGLL